MAKFLVTYYETLVGTYEVEADNENEAEEILLNGIGTGEKTPPETLHSYKCIVEKKKESKKWQNTYLNIKKYIESSMLLKRIVMKKLKKK